MDRKQTLKITVDALMTLALLMLMAYELIGQTTHGLTGTGRTAPSVCSRRRWWRRSSF